MTTLNDYDLGYEFSAPRRPSEPGSPRLEINLCETPTHKHYDPLKIYLPVASEHGGIDFITIEYPWPAEEQYRLCAGALDIIDHMDKHLNVFTFGGSLLIQPGEACLKVVIDSSAPILHASLSHPATRLLMEECQILLAQRRGAWEHDGDEFEKRLVSADPLSLYLVCLRSLQERFRHLPQRVDDTARQFSHLLQAEITACREPLPTSQEISLETLL